LPGISTTSDLDACCFGDKICGPPGRFVSHGIAEIRFSKRSVFEVGTSKVGTAKVSSS